MAEENPFARLFSKPTITAQLAVVEAGKNDAPLSLRLINADPSSVSYRCISYDRSIDYDTVDISVDGQPLSTPQPLVEALRALRMQEHPRTFWADLLVGNSAEQRSRQASTMKSVIENSDSVVVWPGPSKPSTTKAFAVLQVMANRYQQACIHSGFPNSARATQQQTADLMKYLGSSSLEGLETSDKALWEDVAQYLSSSYFSSVQSIPEIVLAKKTIVMSGDSSLSWPDFVSASRAAPFYMAHKVQMPVVEAQITAFEQIHGLDIAERRRRKGDSVELFPMVQQARECSTTDLREIVFSMLPIISPSLRTSHLKKEPPPVADYTKSVQDVFTDAARYIVHERQDLLVWWAESPPRRRRVLGLPSWVPDWSTGPPKASVKVMPTDKNGMRRWWDHLRPAPRRITVDQSNILHVQANALDKITWISPILTASNCRRQCLEAWRALPTLPGENDEAKLTKLWRSMVYNQGGMGESMSEPAVPPKEMSTSFFSIIAEERILEMLGCTLDQLKTRPDLIARARADPEMNSLGPFTGRSPPFEDLLHSNGLGRRVFHTASSRVGMTGVEALVDGPEEQPSGPPAPDFDNLMHDPLARSMMGAFQNYLQQREPAAARLVQQSLDGDLQGQRFPGARVGDIVVALVGGFQPYILRAVRASEPSAGESSQTTLESVSKYTFVGESYLYGVMDGEPFHLPSSSSSSSQAGGVQWKPDVKLVDISIV